MPYSKSSNFNPSTSYKNAWSQTPQNLKLSISGFETNSMYSGLSSLIPIFYVLMILAILFDVYLGVSVLAKSGVNAGLIVGAICADLFLAIFPVLGANLSDVFRPVKVENKIFSLNLIMMSKYIDGNDASKRGSAYRELKSYKNKRFLGKLIHFVLGGLIFAIAGWKIYTYYSVLPPGMNIFSMVNGKIVIIFSILCAIFHLIGSEKAVAHFNFWRINKSEFDEFVARGMGEPDMERIPLEIKANYKPAKSGDTSVVIDDEGGAWIEYNQIIWDDEIKNLVEKQTDDNAKRGVAIKCKENQLQ